MKTQTNKPSTRKYYGFRFFSGRNTRWGDTPYVAGQLKAFDTLDSLEWWLALEVRGAPCGDGGGERIRVTRKEAISLIGSKQFNDGSQ